MLESYVFNDFSGGWNTRDGPFRLQDNESPDLLNVTLTSRGVLKKRPGKVRFDASGFPAAKRAEHLRSWYPGSSRFLMASVDGTIYSSDTAGALTSRVAGTAGAHWMMEDMQDVNGTQFLWAVNGVDAPRRLSTAFAVTNWTAPVDTDTDYHIIRVWRNRMVAVKKNTNRLYISAIGNPESFGVNDFIDVKASDDDNDWITWMEVLGDNLLIFKKQSVWSLYAEPPAPAIRQVGGPGAEDRFQSCIIDGRCYFWNRAGLYSTDGDAEPQEETGDIQNWLRDNLNHARHGQVRVAPGRDRRVFVSMCSGADTENDTLLELVPYLATEDGDVPIVRHDISVMGMATFRASNVDNLVGGASDTNKLHTLFTGTNDDGVAIRGYWQSSWKSIIAEEKFERLRRLNVLMEGQVTAQILKEFLPVVSYSKFLEVPIGIDPLWDGGAWDGGTWDSSSAAELQLARPETRARYHSVRLEDATLDKSFTIYSIEMMIRGGKEH